VDNKLDSKDMEVAFEIKSLRKRIQELEVENTKLKKVLTDNDLADEIANIPEISDEEFICVNEIKKLRTLSETGFLEEAEVKMLDILHKNLRAIRGMSPMDKESKKLKKADVKELFKIVEGNKGV